MGDLLVVRMREVGLTRMGDNPGRGSGSRVDLFTRVREDEFCEVRNGHSVKKNNRLVDAAFAAAVDAMAAR